MASLGIPNAFHDSEDDFLEILPDSKLMETPLKLIEWTPAGDLQLNQETAQLLDKLETPIVVVGIAGSYRSGKSYLMNLLAGKKTGFELGSTVESHTKGIWIWCRPHPILEDTTLILMDTEGLDDVSTGDDNRDMQIIVLTLLLSSSFIYNTTGRVDNSLIKQLGFVSELTNYIQVKSAPSDQVPNDVDFDFYFPALVVTVRDFVLELQIAGQTVCASDYFEHCLTLKETNTKGKGKIADFNEPRIKIRKYFPKSKRHCFVLPQPVKNFCSEVLKKLSFLSIEEMNPEFLAKSKEYQKSILNISGLKSFGQFDTVNGRMFNDMATSYVISLMSGQMPCIQSALKLTARNENKRILDECLKKYDKYMIELNFPLSQEELRNAHEATVDDITKSYKQKIIFEESDDFQDDLKNKVVVAFERVVMLNENSSRETCEAILKDLNGVIEQKMMQKFYLSPGGYDLYMTDVKELKNKYNSVQHKGVKSEQVLYEFIQKKEPEINNIIAIDREMTAVKVKAEGEKRLRQEIELREKMLRDEVEEAKKREEVLQKTMVETRKEMEAEFEKRLEQQRDEYERFMQERQTTQEEITSELRQEIEGLKSRLNSQTSTSRRRCVIS